MRFFPTSRSCGVLVLLVLMGVSACGQKGPLRLPPEAPKPNTGLATSKTVVSVSVADVSAIVSPSAVVSSTSKPDANE